MLNTQQAAFHLDKTIKKRYKMKIKLQTHVIRQLADLNTAVSIYLKLRDHYSNVIMLESNDFTSKENSHSYIGLEPIGSYKVHNGTIYQAFPNGEKTMEKVQNTNSVPHSFQAFLNRFEVENLTEHQVVNGFFGHTSFEAVQYFDTLKFNPNKKKIDIPDIQYYIYKYVIAIHHFKDELFILQNVLAGEKPEMEEVKNLINSQRVATQKFQLDGEEQSNLTDQEFRDLVTAGKHHCQIGDVFQIVFSRQFSQKYKGDDFNVYRVLRSINPSPYLYYFDCGNFKIFGSSPEAQMIIKEKTATLNPIAGTYKRTGDLLEDNRRAIELTNDPKENAEHIMLVDLARNDLAKHSTDVMVKELKGIQFFSHVIHLVSKVEGLLDNSTNPIRVFGDTFPAGTLSGAPKYKAIELISEYENQNRSFYGGAIGYIDFNGDMNQAIVIRSFLSKDHTLYCQAGAGIVVASDEEKELQEVNNKLGALKKALGQAEQL